MATWDTSAEDELTRRALVATREPPLQVAAAFQFKFVPARTVLVVVLVAGGGTAAGSANALIS